MRQAILFSKIEKIVVNAGIGRLSGDSAFKEKILPAVTEEFSKITGQKPSLRPTRVSIASFKIREGNVVGLKATLRRERMASFFRKIVAIILPRTRDFRGVPLAAVDENGNLSIGLRDQLVFPEISAEYSRVSFGLQITVVPKPQYVKTREQAIELYRQLSVPFAKRAPEPRA